MSILLGANYAVRSCRRLVFFALCLVSACSAPLDPRTTFRVGYFPNITHSQALIGIAQGAFQNALGTGITLDAKVFNAGPSVIEALFAGEIDLAYIGPNPAVNGFIKSKGQALVIVAGATSGGAVLVVRRDAGISTPADLAGKRIATPELGNTQDVAARFYLLSNKLQVREKGGNVDILPTKNADILTLFLKKEIDGAWVPEPWGARLVQEAQGSVLVDERSLWPEGRFVTAHVIASVKTLRERPDVVKDWLRAHISITQWIQSHPTEAKRIANSEIARLSGKALNGQVLDEAWERMEVTYDPVSASLRGSADRAYQVGLLGKEKPQLDGIYDLTLLNDLLSEQSLATIY